MKIVTKFLVSITPCNCPDYLLYPGNGGGLPAAELINFGVDHEGGIRMVLPLVAW